MKKLISTLLICTLILGLFTACGVNSPEENTTEPTTAVQSAYPLTVTDQAGRTVTIEKEPQKIVSGYYISTSMLIAMGAHGKIVGIENGAGKRNIYKLSKPEFLSLPSVGTAKDFDLETCASLAPDLVVLPAKLKNVVPSLEELGLTVILVNPENQQQLVEAIALLGKATGCSEKAEQLIKYTDDKLVQLKTKLSAVQEKPTVYLSGNSSFLSTAGSEMYQSSLIVNAGGENVANAITETYWAEIDYEQLLAWNPDYIILAADAEYTVESVLNDKNLSGCTAVKNKNVYQIPGDTEALDSPVPSAVLGTLWLASILNGELYTQADYQQVKAEFYNTFYGFEVK